MRRFSLLPNKRDWMSSEKFLDAQDLHDMYVTPDLAFTPWLFHVTIGQTQCYIKESRGKFKLIIHNFSPSRIPSAVCSGYRCLKCDTFSECYGYFRTLVREIFDFYGDADYGVPF